MVKKIERDRTLVLVKPDGIERGLVGEIIRRLENRGLKVVALKMLKVEKKLAEKHYLEEIAERYGKRVRDGLIAYIANNPVVAMVWEGVEAVKIVRAMCGTTYPNDSAPGTIRGDFCHISRNYADANEVIVRNIIHASADEKDAKREIGLWFDKKEFVEYKRVEEVHLW